MGARAYPEPGDTFGRYRIVRELGRGGYGSVLEARQLDLDRPVALKVLSPVLADEPQFRDRFAREAAMLAHLDSPHVIQVYEHGEQDGHLFIATQLVQGGDLKQLLRDTNGVSPATALDLAAQVASGLADAHDAGLIHRDIKPSNILVRRYGDGWLAYLCDFGIARATDSDYTRTGGVIGSLGYMAPERHQGADATIATDVYSLGCLLWTLLTGVGPFGGTSDVQVALNHIQQPVPQLPGNDAGSRAINEILQRCLAKAPGQRFASARELRTALLRAASMMGQEPLVDATTRPGGSSPESDELPTARPPSQQASRQTARQTSRQTTGIMPRRRHGRTALVSVAVVVFVQPQPPSPSVRRRGATICIRKQTSRQCQSDLSRRAPSPAKRRHQQARVPRSPRPAPVRRPPRRARVLGSPRRASVRRTPRRAHPPRCSCAAGTTRRQPPARPAPCRSEGTACARSFLQWTNPASRGPSSSLARQRRSSASTAVT